ncbi:hypothetical protein PHYBLDRAFT_148280 [Phycomyces blakesleeanus NRRL 1555(-)]|uniref:ATP-dependent DNA helicase n=1 Tax=Phycomyces blakesleeanus (strain ATCC 8743b / DSM 1359 / FGSC 10004 / NBRC 33097 / NRRL 1555) TaxID=763407 RepID=A0A162TZD0_PHYB8|nr:hypothetical protein PHYBLDRAFT_148280 [Phycomyces blakesleeanus NRRL 1555(-)]OAD71063.1 hypothetical protein PHYBLDRAFT_148280 [Phycomyces blakesleeanus NRRL 1555(-)]|eukprot:XP_018289103.1 hypothetical protein PHYBLDRAFT_148280 [Phycomyces blakesleeanus NRRL 1555(-)]
MTNVGTILMAWFKYNKKHIDARKHLYYDFPSHFIWNSNQAACRALGLLINNCEWDACMEEPPAHELLSSIRQLFAVLLVFCHVSDSYALWITHHSSMMKYYLQQEDLCAKASTLPDSDLFLFNSNQRTVYNTILDPLNATKISFWFFFIDGPSGTGKTFIFNALLRKVRQKEKFALAVATSGISEWWLHNTFAFHDPI